MTFWAKMLTVFVLVLSVIFAAVSTVLFATKTEWRQAYDVQRQTHRSELSSLESRISGLEGNLTTTKSERDVLRREREDWERLIFDLEARVAEQTADISDRSRTIEALRASLTHLQEEKKTWQPTIDGLRASLEERTNQLRQETARLQEMVRENEKLALSNSNLTEDLVNARAHLNEALETLAAKERILADLGRVYPDIRDFVDRVGVLPVERIQGKVVAVDKDANMVIINVGASDNVRREHQFTVYRGATFKGLVRIFELEGDHLSAAHIELVATGDDGRPLKIEIGDDVKTGIGL